MQSHDAQARSGFYEPFAFACDVPAPFDGPGAMPKLYVLPLYFLITGCTDMPDTTTSAINAANRHGGVCFADRAGAHYACADRALRGISQLVFNAPA
jgi:hypothetical protein